MNARRSSSALVATLLALLAIFSMHATSSWHDSIFHDEPTLAHSLSVHHSDGERPDDTTSLIHLAAHCIGHWVGLPGHVDAPAPFVAGPRTWSMAPVATLTGTAPPSVLRPPEA